MPKEEKPRPRKKLSRSAPCPCDSGKKYKNCCWDKGFNWEEDEEGNVYKSTPMMPEVKEALEQLRQAFIVKHGRESVLDDLLFPDIPLGRQSLRDWRLCGPVVSVFVWGSVCR